MNRFPPIQISKEGPLLVFVHANGYPPETYRSFLDPFLSDFQVWTIYLRPFWSGSDPQHMHDWRVFRDDTIPVIKELVEKTGSKQPVIGLGHSLGGATLLMSAIQEPELFSQLVLMDPVIFPRWRGTLMRMASPLKLIRKYHPLIRGTLRRKTWFESREAMYLNYRGKKVFSAFSDQVLKDYVEGLANDLTDGVGLRYPPAWEARIYETGGRADWVIWRGREKIKPPTLIIRGEDTYTLRDRLIQSLVGRMPRGEYATVLGSGHLLPLEDPQGTAEVALGFLERNLEGKTSS